MSAGSEIPEAGQDTTAQTWWDALSPETQAALKSNTRRHLDPYMAGDAQRAGAILVSTEVEGEEEPRTMLPDPLIEFIESRHHAT